MITQYAQLLKKAPSWIYKIGAQAYIDKSWPRHLFLETTAACNLSCSYCPREKIKNHMDFELFKQIIDEASHYGARSFSLHLFGEPLLYPKIGEAVRYIKKRNRAHTILLTTNGTLLERYLDEVKQADKIIWSWRPETRFTQKFKEKLKGTHSFTVRLIKETVPEADFLEWSAWPRVEVRSVHNYGGEISPEKFGVEHTAGTRHPCYHLFLAPAVAWNGNFLICCADPHQKEIVGNVKTEKVSALWKKMDGIRKAHMKGEYTGICADCDVWKSYPDLFFKWQKR